MGTISHGWTTAEADDPAYDVSADEINDHVVPTDSIVKNNFGATTDPAVTDDSGDGYEVGSRWINASTGARFDCLDASSGAAVWIRISAQSFVGYDAVGASFENLVGNRQYMKKVTLASPGRIESVDFHVQASVTDPTGFLVGVLEDSSGLPTLSRAASFIDQRLGLKGGNAARWLSVPLGAYLPAGDYWLAVTCSLVGASGIQIAYDTGGADRYFTVGPYVLDGDHTGTTDSTLKYSIRASFLS